MEIKLITSNKKQFLDLLLLADEQESMIDKYLERGEMFALYDDGLKAISVVTCEGEGIYEIKNIAVCPSSQRKGYGKRLVDYLFGYYHFGVLAIYRARVAAYRWRVYFKLTQIIARKCQRRDDFAPALHLRALATLDKKRHIRTHFFGYHRAGFTRARI